MSAIGLRPINKHAPHVMHCKLMREMMSILIGRPGGGEQLQTALDGSDCTAALSVNPFLTMWQMP